MGKRILTPTERELHILRHAWKAITAEGKELLGDLATFNSNQQHNPQTGFNEFLPDTPEWIREIGYKRGWASKKTKKGA